MNQQSLVPLPTQHRSFRSRIDPGSLYIYLVQPDGASCNLCRPVPLFVMEFSLHCLCELIFVHCHLCNTYKRVSS